MKKKFLSLILVFFTFLSSSFCFNLFNGYAGGRLNYGTLPENSSYTPNLTLTAFFTGQFNFAQDVWGRLDFSINTNNLINEKYFIDENSNPANFQLSELSVTGRFQINSSSNYLSAFLGTFDPIGSDIFLQRYLSSEPINSKLTEYTSNNAGSIIYPHYGGGICDILRFYKIPMAAGAYVYFNKEDTFILNIDFRNAGIFRHFTYDVSAGMGIPIANQLYGDDVFVMIDFLNFHAGFTMLAGNNYTSGFFMQAGFKASVDKTNITPPFNSKNIYILMEPRFLIKKTHLNLSIFSLPDYAVDKMLNINDSMGLNFNVYVDPVLIAAKEYIFGTHIGVSFPNKTFLDIPAMVTPESNTFTDPKNHNIYITPYMSTKIVNGDFNAQIKINLSEFFRTKWYNGITVTAGYKYKF